MKHKHSKKLIITFIVLLILVIVSTIGILLLKKQKTKTAKQTIKKQNTVQLSKKDLVSSVSATGTIESNHSQNVSANTNGSTVKTVHVAIGDTVKKGDTLITFDTSDESSTLTQAQQDYSTAQTDAADDLSDANADLATAKSNYSSASAKQDKKVAEAKTKYQTAKNKVSSIKEEIKSEKDPSKSAKLSEELTKAQETLSQAKESYEQAKETRDNTNQQNQNAISSAQKTVKQTSRNNQKTIQEASNKVDDAKENISKGTITAPCSGLITALNVSEGDTYSGGTLLQIDDVSSYTISTTVDEYDISKVEKGQKVIIKTDATEDDELEGEVTFVAPALSTSTSNTNANAGGTSSSGSDGYQVSIKINSTDERLRLGLTAKCSIVTEEAENVFAVPYDAVSKNSDGTSYITVIDSDNSQTNTSHDNQDSNDPFSNKNTDQTQNNHFTDTNGNQGSRNFSDENKPSMASGDPSGENRPPVNNNQQVTSNSTNSVTSSSKTQSTRQITVTTGLQTDYYIAISSDDLTEGLQVVLPSDETSTASTDTNNSTNFPGMMGQGNKDMGAPSGQGNKGMRNGQDGNGGGPNGNR